MTPPAPIIRQCVQCGTEFVSHSGKLTCSDKCRKARKRNQDIRCKSGKGVIGTKNTCQCCGKEFVMRAPGQKFCSDKCQNRQRVLSGADKIKNIPATCIVCGKEFLTARSSMAKTCGKECASIYRTSRMKESSANDASWGVEPTKYWAHDMKCPWENGLFDMEPAPGVSWYGAEADPMTLGAWTGEMQHQRVEEVAA